MKKLFTFLTLFLLLMGSGTAWATFSWDGTHGIWDFTQGVNISHFTGDGWSANNNGDQAWKTFSNASTACSSNNSALVQNWGFDHIGFNGTPNIYSYNTDYARGLKLFAGQTIGINVYKGYVVTITASTKTTKWNADTQQNDPRGNAVNCSFTNVRSTPETSSTSSHFGYEEKTITVVAKEDGWVTMTNTGEANKYKDLYITRITMESKPTMSWTKNEQQLSFDKGDLVAFDYVEPTLEVACLPTGTKVFVTLDNVVDNCVKLKSENWDWNGNYSWELYLLDKGNATVTAHAVTDWGYGQEILTASYFIVVDVDEYTWKMDENDPYKYILTGAGAILDPYVQAVPYITMTYGDPDEVGVVLERNNGEYYAAQIMDPNGNRAVELNNDNLPIHGTFYKFEPQIDGQLNLWVNMYNGGNAVLIDATDPTNPVDCMPSGYFAYNDINVTGGHIYYLFGMTPDNHQLYPSTWWGYNPNAQYDNWTVAELAAFRFEPKADLVYAHKGVVYKEGKFYDINGTKLYDSPRQPIGTGSNESYVLEFYPDDTTKGSTSISSDGTLTIDPDFRGAIAVKATLGSGTNRDYYIVTVPYETHDWWFTESVNPKELVEDRPAAQKQDFTTWGLAYKVLRPEYKTVTINGQSQNLRLRKEVKDPVLCSAKFIHGNNAGYVIQTAGLLFDAEAKRFGVNTDMSYVGLKQTDENGNVITIDDANGIPIDQYLTNWDIDEEALERDEAIAEFAYFKTTADTYGYPTNLVTMATGSTLIIPDLKAGQHIRIYWKRHNRYKGDKYTATGVTDLAGTPITGEFYIGNGNDYLEFIAQGGNATFTLNDNDANTSWTDIYRITVGEVGEFLDTRLNVRGPSIVYNPRNPIPLVVTNPQGETEYIDYHGQKLADDYPGYTLKGHWGPIAQYNEPYLIVTNDNDNETEITFSSAGGTGGNNFSREYKIAGNVGTPLTMESGNKISFHGNGYVAVVCNQKSGDYVINTDTVTVAYGTVDIQTYPHTWDFTKIDVNTTTSDVLAAAYENGTGINWYKKNTWGDPNTADESEFKLWEPATDVEGEWILNGYQKGIKAPVFAQGSQLSDGFNAIEETQGLGIFLRKGVSGNYFGYTMASDAEDYDSSVPSIGLDMLRYGTTNGEGYLSFPAAPSGRSSIIRVPQVNIAKGERVYIAADGVPTVYVERFANGLNGEQYTDSNGKLRDEGNGSDAAKVDLIANSEDGIYTSYFVPDPNDHYNGGNLYDIYIDVTGLKVFKIGVTSTLKKLTDYQGKSYATESRHHNERYDLSGYFTGNDVKAYKVLGYRKSGFHDQIEDEEMGGMTTLAGRLNLEEVEVAPQASGVILVGQGTGFTEEPLFVKDVNTNLSDMTGNYMTPSYTYNADGSANATNIPNDPYILAMKYTPMDANGNVTGPKKDGPLAFYKMISGQLKANLAYFSMPETTPVTKNTTYALNVGDTFTAGEAVQVKEGSSRVATVTYGVSGGADFKAAKAQGSVQGFTAYTEGNGQNGTATSGTVYSIKAEYDGTMEVAVVLNADSPFYILENGTALEGFDGKTVDTKYYGTYSFPVKGGKTYKVYCTGSKLGFYGFNYEYTVEEAGTAANYFVFWFIDDENGEDDLDAIEQALEEQMPDGILSDDAVYYNLNGQKLPGKPSQRGIYICNGKKIFVK